MGKKEVILIGGGGHCRSCIDVIEQEEGYHIAGIVDKAREAGSGKGQAESAEEKEVKAEVKAEVLGYPIIGTDDDLPELRKKYNYALVTVGQIKSPDIRIRLYDRLLELGFEMPTIISPLAYVSPHAEIGQGTIVMHHALVNAGSRIGNNCIINTKALVEHDAVIEDHCHISTGAVINGNTIIGEKSFLGSNSVSKEGILVSSGSVIGAGVKIFDC